MDLRRSESDWLKNMPYQVPSCHQNDGHNAFLKESLNCQHPQLAECSRQVFLGNDVQHYSEFHTQTHVLRNPSLSESNVIHLTCSEGLPPRHPRIRPRIAQVNNAKQTHQVKQAQTFQSKCSSGCGLMKPEVETVNKINYINTDLVQKILSCQKNLRRCTTPIMHLNDIPSTENRYSVGSRSEKPRHHLSDLSLNAKMADCKVSDVDTVSTESQRDSGYHSGESIGDRSSATCDNVDLNRQTSCLNSPDVFLLSSEHSASSDELCEYYFHGADSYMDLYMEQERLGDLHKALTFLDRAIEFFHLASNVPSTSSENILHMRMKHNKAILCRRKLMKQIACSAEKPKRRMPHVPKDVVRTTVVDLDLKIYQSVTSFDIHPEDSLICTSVKNSLPCFSKEPSIYARRTGTVVNYDHNKSTCALERDEQVDKSGSLQVAGDGLKEIRLHGALPKRNRYDHLLFERFSSFPDQSKASPQFCDLVYDNTFSHCHVPRIAKLMQE